MFGVGVAVIVGVGVTSVAPVGDFLVHETETNDITRAINKAEKKNFFTASLQGVFRITYLYLKSFFMREYWHLQTW
jgi:hypothetical protein